MTQRTTAAQRTKYVLDETDLPTQWYNIQADLQTPVPPVLHPGTGQPIGPQDLASLFPMALIAQEVSQERWIDIPDEVRDVLRELRALGCDIVTLGQYLQPSVNHLEVARYVHPDEFAALREWALGLGFPHVEAGPLVRSSYHADAQARLLAPPAAKGQ